jgi:hypothetical protein
MLPPWESGRTGPTLAPERAAVGGFWGSAGLAELTSSAVHRTGRHPAAFPRIIGTSRHSNNRVKLGIGDIDRTLIAIRGVEGKRLMYRNLTEPVFSYAAKRFLRWRKKRKFKKSDRTHK